MKQLMETQSICPICNEPVKAFYIAENENVFLRKTCKNHGKFESFIADNEEEFLKWAETESINIPPRVFITKGISESKDLGECPLHCGVCENHLQTACCVLIDITNRCNQKCPYCFASAEDIVAEEPSLEELNKKFDLLLQLGEERTYNIQLSGGEPTVRDDLPEIIRLAKSKGFEYIQINTNGKRLAQEPGYAKIIKDAGASVIFMQFDGTDDSIYKKMRGEVLFETKKKAIENCRAARIPVTIVPTVAKNVNLDNIGNMVDFLLENVDVVKGIHFQPLSFFGRHPEELPVDELNDHKDFENRVTLFDIMNQLEIQTNGKIKKADFYTTTSGHPLCSFSSSYKKNYDGTVDSMISKETKSLGGCCGNKLEPIEVIKKDRDYVVSKWEMADSDGCSCKCECEPDLMSLESFIYEMRSNMFSVSSMAFMDQTNIDAERIKRCRVQVLSKDNRLIPFCAYNSIYREQDI